MTGNKFFTLLLFLTTALSSHAQTPPYEKYTSKSGLISDRITAIAQDDNGFMWFGSFFGICRYDGVKFQKISLPQGQQNKYVNFVAPAGNRIYAGFLFGGGLAEYDNGQVHAHFIKGRDSSLANEFTCMYDNKDGSIFLCNTANQLYQFKNGVFSFMLDLGKASTFRMRSMQKDRYDNLWIASEHGLFILPYPYASAKVFFENENIYALVKRQNGNLCFSRTDGNAATLEDCDGWKNGIFINEKIIARSTSWKAVPFSGSAPTGFWTIDFKKFLTHITPGQKNDYYTIPVDFSTDINSVFEDRENNIWIANEPGVIKVANFNVQTYRFDEIAAGGGSISRENDSVVWVTNSKSLYTISDSLRKVNFTKQHPDYYGVLHRDSKENLWVGLWNGGLWWTKWTSEKLRQKKFISDFGNKKVKVQALQEDSDGNIWVGGMNGLFHIRDNKVIDEYQPVNAYGSPAFITCMTIDEKNKTLWLGDNAAGVIKLNYELKDNKASYKVTGYVTSKEGLSDMYIRSILKDGHDNLWIGTRYGGIYRVKENKDHLAVVNENANAKLSCTRITDIKEEDSARVWFAACDGIYSYTHTSATWQNFNTGKGLLNSEVFALMVEKEKGFVLILTSEGITKLRLDSMQKTVPPLVSINSVTILGKPDSSAVFSHSHKYSYRQNSVGFSFVGTSFIDEKKNRYKYMLDGYDHDWSQPVMINTVHYASLPPGKYIFKVLAENVKGQWSEKPATFEFEIVIPFYRKPAFILLFITVVIFAIYFLRMHRLRDRFKIERLRLHIARDLHDDIGSNLGSINILTKTATRKIQKDPSQQEINSIFQKIGQSAENTLDAMDDIVWSINPDKDKVQDLIIRMREFAIPLLEAKNIKCEFIIDGDKKYAVPMNIRRNIFLIYKESVYNILKHSNATAASISLYISSSRLSLNIRDNGCGFNKDRQTGRSGLKNMHSRAELIDGALEITSSANGTVVSLSAPIR